MYLLNQLINIDEFELDVLNQDTIKGYLDLLMLVSGLEAVSIRLCSGDVPFVIRSVPCHD